MPKRTTLVPLGVFGHLLLEHLLHLKAEHDSSPNKNAQGTVGDQGVPANHGVVHEETTGLQIEFLRTFPSMPLRVGTGAGRVVAMGLPSL